MPFAMDATLQQLVAGLHELDDLLSACMRCGFCQSVCPLYAHTGLETDVARGKLALIAGLGQRLIQDAQGVRRALERCLLCGACAAGCPSGARVMDIFILARSVLAGYLGLSPAKKLLFRQILARPRLFDGLLALAPRWQGLITRPAHAELETARSRVPALLARRHFTPLAPRPLRLLLARRRSAPLPPGRPRVALFWGCLVDKLYPRLGLDTLRVLEHHGLGAVLIPGLACCGMPALASGDSRAFSIMLEHNLARLDPDRFDYLVTPCATCASAIKKLWPLMGKHLEQRRLARVAGKTRELSQMLVEEDLVKPALPGGQPVTYHDPCHLQMSLGVRDEPRRLLAAAGELREMSRPGGCCGMGGSFSLEHQELSRDIGRRKREDILKSGCAEVATACPACMLQISGMLSRAGGGPRVRHVVEIYARALDGPQTKPHPG